MTNPFMFHEYWGRERIGTWLHIYRTGLSGEVALISASIVPHSVAEAWWYRNIALTNSLQILSVCWCGFIPKLLLSNIIFLFFCFFPFPSSSYPVSFFEMMLLYFCCWSLLYSAVLRSRAESITALACDSTWVTSRVFKARFWISTEVACLQRIGASSLYTIQPCTMSLHAKPHT